MSSCIKCNKETKNSKFCSRSCSISFNNAKSPKRKAIKKICNSCNCEYKGENKKFCSQECVNKVKLDNLIKDGNFKKAWNNNRSIRNYLIRNHGNKCMICGIDADNWNGKKLTLIVDHIDGDANNYSINNIQIVCPNCDSQLPTFKGRNKGKSTRKFYIVQK